jgi:ribonuclease HI
MPEEFMLKIAAICPPSHDDGRDSRAGVGGNAYGFSVATMYNNICGFPHKDDYSVWSKVWKLMIPERVKAFMWMAMHNRLITNSLKSKMGLCHAMCSYCGNVEETTLHVLRDCSKAQNLWYNLIPVQHRGIFFMGELQTWCSSNLLDTTQWSGCADWCETWAITCHCLWSWRNKELFDEEFIRPLHEVHVIQQKVQEYKNAARLNRAMVEKPQTVALIKWNPPREGYIKLNTDGACKSGQLAGCGGVIRGSQGEWIHGFAKNVGKCNAFVAELWGVLEGLRCVRRMGFSKVEINIDSVSVVQLLQQRNLHSMSGGTVTRQIWKLLDLNWDIEITHSYREANKCADALANVGCSLGRDIVFYDVCPPFLSHFLVEDNLGITTPRLVSV